MLLKHLPALDPANFKGLTYWYRAPWASIRGGKAIKSTDDPTLTLFLEDATGNLVPQSEMQAVRDYAGAFFKQLWADGRAPGTWSDAPLNLRISYVRWMEEEFEFLRYCDRHWKTEQVFMNYYPNWYRHMKNPEPKKRAKRARPDDENQGNNDDDNASSKRPRVEEIESTPPAQPASTAVTTTRKRVRSLWYLAFILTKNSQNNPL